MVELAWMNVAEPERITSLRFKPSKEIEFGALATHHISMEDLTDCPPSTSAKLPEGYDYIIGHNVDYDWEVLGRPPMLRIDTLSIARGLWPDGLGHSLGACCYRLWPAAEAKMMLQNAHSADADVAVCYRVLQALRRRLQQLGYSTDLDSLYRISESCRIPTIMTFGKYRDRPVAEVDAGWKKWYFSQKDTDPYVIRALRGEKGGLPEVW